MQAIEINKHSFSAHFPNSEQVFLWVFFQSLKQKTVSGGGPGFLQGQKSEENSGTAFSNKK